MYDSIMIGFFLFALVGLSFYAGHLYAIPRVTEAVLMVLHNDRIIRLIELEDGEVEVYSGSKFYNSETDNVT